MKRDCLRKPPRAALVLLAAGGIFLIGCDVNVSPTIPASVMNLVGSGNVVQETRSVPAFGSVEMAGVGAVTLEQAAAFSVVVQADDNLLPWLRTEVVGGTLVISTQPGRSLRPSETIRYIVALPDLESARLTGVGEIECIGLGTARVRLESAGVGSVRFTRMNVGELEVETHGEGGVVVSGAATRQRVRLSGVLDYNARGLRSSEADIEMAGLASATVRVRDRLTAALGGSGCLYYIGDPAVETTGSGCIEKLAG